MYSTVRCHNTTRLNSSLNCIKKPLGSHLCICLAGCYVQNSSYKRETVTWNSSCGLYFNECISLAIYCMTVKCVQAGQLINFLRKYTEQLLGFVIFIVLCCTGNGEISTDSQEKQYFSIFQDSKMCLFCGLRQDLHQRIDD